ncbi:MAG: holo-[acyl-carrier-protein] synthase [Anaerolineae bacterium]|nr:MAG: holo-[acyl-carrier-protein] synthase [Anaerolineae bacterium]
MNLAVGVDILEVDRMSQGIARYGNRFCDRFFTPLEQEQCGGRAASLAGRFAIKEAVGKALGTGIGDVAWKDIEVVSDVRGRPMLVLHGAAARLAAEQGLGDWAISLSHTATHAVGMAVAMKSLTDARGTKTDIDSGAGEGEVYE